MKKIFLFSLLTISILGTSFAQDQAPVGKRTEKKDAKADKKEAKGKMKKSAQKDAKADKKESKAK